MPYRTSENVIAVNPFLSTTEFLGSTAYPDPTSLDDLSGFYEEDEQASIWESIFDWIEQGSVIQYGEGLQMGVPTVDALLALHPDLSVEDVVALSQSRPVFTPYKITTSDINDIYNSMVDAYGDYRDGLEDDQDPVAFDVFANSLIGPNATEQKRDEWAIQAVVDDVISDVRIRGNEKQAWENWKLTASKTLGIDQAIIEDWKLSDATAAWRRNVVATGGQNDDNRFFSDFLVGGLTEQIIKEGRLIKPHEATAANRLSGILSEAELYPADMTPDQQSILTDYEGKLTKALSRAQGIYNVKNPGEELPDAEIDAIVNATAQNLVSDLMTPARVPLTQERLLDMFNNSALRNLGIVLGDLSGPASTDEQYIARVVYKRVLDGISAAAAQGTPRSDIDVMSMTDDAFKNMPSPEEIDRRQQLRFGQMPPGTVLIGDKPDEPQRPVGAVDPDMRTAQNTLDTRRKDLAQKIMDEQIELDDPITYEEAFKLATDEIGEPDIITEDAPSEDAVIPEEPPQITAETENLRRYNAVQVILDMPDGQEKQDALRQFVTDEGLSQRLLQGKPVLDAEGNQVLDADGKPAFTDAPINEAAVIMAAVQEGAMGAIMGQRETQVGKSLEDVQSNVDAFRSADTAVRDIATKMNINIDEYEGGNPELDEAMKALDLVSEQGLLAQKQLEQREKEEQIREEGFPIDITQLPSSEEPMAVGGASSAWLEAQEKERQRQQQAAAAAQRRAEADAATRTLGGRLGA